MPSITYLGHAGFVVDYGGIRLLIDPWFFPAFLGSWFPYPDNRHLMDQLLSSRFDYLYVSHSHQDHFDVRFLAQLDRSTTVIVPKYRSGALKDALEALGFEDLVLLDHRQSWALAERLNVTMYLDTSHKEDSGLLVDMGGFRFLDLNDCNTALSELPGDVDLLAAQFSGAMWYPNCYDYPASVMRDKVDVVGADLLDTLCRKVRLTGARHYLPSAGPACFLDPVLADYNDREATIFKHWEQVAEAFTAGCPGVNVLRASPGDRVSIGPSAAPVLARTRADRPPASALDDYRQRRSDEWGEFYRTDATPASVEEVAAYFDRLLRLNAALLEGSTRTITVISGADTFTVTLGTPVGHATEEEETAAGPPGAEYVMEVPPPVLRAILVGSIGWEEALLSMRIGLHRQPDTFDVTLMSLLRYGDQPSQIRAILRQRRSTETIERDGLRMQRFCPHAGEDLTFAEIHDGVIECPRHHWMWDALTGRCIDKGTVDLRVEVIDMLSPTLRSGPARPAADELGEVALDGPRLTSEVIPD